MPASTITITGWVANDPYINKVDASTRFVSFRVGSTPRYFDRSKDEWADGKTEWFTVKAWRDAADNIGESVRKSQPVIVHGRLVTEEWESETGPRKDLVIEAITVGHDLTRGKANFMRIVTASESAAGSDGDDDQPADDDAAYAALGVAPEPSVLVGAH